MIMLLEGRSGDDPLFLQAKEAMPSVLEEHLEPGPYDNHGRRVVESGRLATVDGRELLARVGELTRGWKI